MNGLFKYILIGLLIIIFTCLAVSCTRAKTFNGRVIDADTGEPLEGAVVVVVWKTERTTPTATHVDPKDAKECLTDKNGEWSLNGPKGRDEWPIPYMSLFIPYTKQPEFIVFKPGYCSWPNGFYIDACRDRIKIKGGRDKRIGEGGTLKLPKLMTREDRLKTLPSPVEKEGESKKDFFKKQKLLLKLIDEERRHLGIQEFQILKEFEDEK